MMNSVSQPRVLCGALIALLMLAPTPSSGQTGAGEDLSIQQARLADRYERLELVATRLAELSAAADPGRAKLLRDAIARSRELDVSVRFEAIVALLENERLAAANRNQVDLHNELRQLLELLLTDTRDEEIESQQRRIRKYLREVGRLIRWQKGIRARTQSGDELDRLEQDQRQAADGTAKLAGQIESTEGGQASGAPDSAEDGDQSDPSDETQEGASPAAPESPGEGTPSESEQSGEGQSSEGQSSEGQSSEGQSSEGQSSEGQSSEGQSSEGQSSEGQSSEGQSSEGQSSEPSSGQGSESTPAGSQPEPDPSQRAASRLQAAEERMRRAEEQLENAQREEATADQERALRELEQARAELEKILRQMREEEMQRMLTRLAARFRRMLEAQIQVYDGTLQVAQVPTEERSHREEIEAARLSRQESLIVRDADKALVLLREEGSSVAFPETIEQLRDDMQDVTDRLADTDVDQMTQALEQDIIEALEEALATLEQALSDLEQNRTPPGQLPAAGQPIEPPLVDKIAELKMIRSLQLRINRRTVRYGKMMVEEQAETAELFKALQDLAGRQDRVYAAAKDLALGRND